MKMKTLKPLCLLAAFIFAATPPLLGALEGEIDAAVENKNYQIGDGDLLQIEVYDEPDLTKEVRVLTDGHISFPLLGSIQAGGHSVGELEIEITRRLAEK